MGYQVSIGITDTISDSMTDRQIILETERAAHICLLHFTCKKCGPHPHK